MKYWTQLNNLETEIIRLEEMRCLFSVLANGAEESNPEDIRSALWYIEGSLNSIHQNLRSEFNELWEIVSNDDNPKEKHKGGMKKKKMMTDRELP